MESGLDSPSVNTLIVEDSHLLGLSELYQLRGRIGREKRKAHCFLFRPSGDFPAAMTQEAKKRLEAIQEFSELGSGFRLALRDLEIRGAGDLLGPQQHGFVRSIGLDLYCQMIQEEVAELKGYKLPPEPPPVALEVQAAACLPQNYLPGESARLETYKRILSARQEQDLRRIQAELRDLCGPEPEPVRNLFELACLRLRCLRMGIASVVERKQSIQILWREGHGVSSEKSQEWLNRYSGNIRFVRVAGSDGISLSFSKDVPVLDWIRGFLSELE